MHAGTEHSTCHKLDLKRNHCYHCLPTRKIRNLFWGLGLNFSATLAFCLASGCGAVHFSAGSVSSTGNAGPESCRSPGGSPIMAVTRPPVGIPARGGCHGCSGPEAQTGPHCGREMGNLAASEMWGLHYRSHIKLFIYKSKHIHLETGSM